MFESKIIWLQTDICLRELIEPRYSCFYVKLVNILKASSTLESLKRDAHVSTRVPSGIDLSYANKWAIDNNFYKQRELTVFYWISRFDSQYYQG